MNEATQRPTEHGLVVDGDGWFVVNARDAHWRDRGPRGLYCDFEADTEFPQLGIGIFVLEPGQPMSMYHWEVDQEDFLVLSGEPLLIVEGEERHLKPWDFVHCPPHTPHVIVGAGSGPSAILAVGARAGSTGPGWGAYPVDETAARHGAAVERATTSAQEAYAPFPRSEPSVYRDGWLP